MILVVSLADLTFTLPGFWDKID